MSHFWQQFNGFPTVHPRYIAYCDDVTARSQHPLSYGTAGYNSFF